MNILDEIAGRTRERIAEERGKVPLQEIRAQAEAAHRAGTAFADGGPVQEPYAFERALRHPGETNGHMPADDQRLSLNASAAVKDSASADNPRQSKHKIAFICEVKKASPSKGLIAPDFPYLQIALEYEQAGAAAISCLTEPYYFQGHDAYLREIAQNVRIPVLRKDFTVDEYMIYQARAFGAGAVLLIGSILDDAQLRAYGQLAAELGLSALVEAHTEEEVGRAMNAGAKILGVNNRDLKTFQVDLGTSARYRKLVPPETIFVSESGVRNADDIKKLVENGTNAVLIGETLMRAADKKAMLCELRGESF
ncbi:MAG: indole-3-glycerol phosphate synthase TrpC [Lachnospiraceae bacterium]|nr:indole-3-glycerol phosphate synthase TrpC [Lachnospiraceae bacterium]